MVEQIAADVLVAGGGVGGLMAAYRAQRAGARVVLLGGSGGASNRISSLNTTLAYAPEDHPPGLFDDIFRAGGYINDPALVARLSHRIGPETLHLAELGVPFARDGDRLARRQAAGSTWRRAVFSLGMVGVDIARQLVDAMEVSDSPPLTHVRGGLLLDLHTVEGRAVGGLAYSTREDRWLQVSAPAVVLATGGGGQLFGKTTNPRGSRGIGYAMALEAGAELVDMEFVSFEPFVTAAAGQTRAFDLPTTVLREGLKLRNGRGEEFLDTSQAPSKDIICRAMVREVAEGRGTPSGAIFYDLREMEPEAVERYVQIGEALRSFGMQPQEAQLEVMPAQHYLMGGVRIDADAATTVPGLYAVGEVAGGAHGGHRLAAGGGMEVVAGGAIAGDSAAAYAADHAVGPVRPPVSARPELRGVQLSEESEKHLAQIRRALDDGCGILRTGADLAPTVRDVHGVLEAASAPERTDPFLRRCALVALAIAQAALARTECRGDHYRTDHPQRDDLNWLGNLSFRLAPEGDLRMRYQPAAIAQRPWQAETVAVQ